MPEFWVHFNVYCDVKEPGLNSIRCIKFITKSTKSPIIFNPFNSRPWLKKSANSSQNYQNTLEIFAKRLSIHPGDIDGAVTDDAAGAVATAVALFTGRLATVAVGAGEETGATLTGCPVKELSNTPALTIHLLYGTGAVDGRAEVVFVSGLNCTTRVGFSPPPLLLAFLSALGGIVAVKSPSLFVVVVVVVAADGAATSMMAEDELQESLFSSSVVSAIFLSAAVSSFATAVGGLGALFFFVLGLATASWRLNVSADATEALASSKLGGYFDAVLISGLIWILIYFLAYTLALSLEEIFIESIK